MVVLVENEEPPPGCEKLHQNLTRDADKAAFLAVSYASKAGSGIQGIFIVYEVLAAGQDRIVLDSDLARGLSDEPVYLGYTRGAVYCVAVRD